MFPIINHLDDLRPHIADRKEINITTQSNGFHVVCYSISGPNTFSDPDPIKESFLRECRGITFYPDGKIASRSLHKFFNVGEREETQEHNLDMSSSNVARFMQKRDGSMLHAVNVGDKIVLKSKKSFTSDVAIMATNFLYLPENENVLHFCAVCIATEITPTFEFTAPNNRIVLNYDKPELKLLHIRDLITGEYVVGNQLSEVASNYNVPLVETYDVKTMQDKINNIPTIENIEGYVFQFQNGDMVKWKTPWYINLHHTVTFTRVRDVAEMVLNEQVDDYKSYLMSVNAEDLFKKVLVIEEKVLSLVLELRSTVENIIEDFDGVMTRKDFAMLHKQHPFFSLIMQKFSGNEPKYKDFYISKFLKEDFGLESL